MKNEMNNALLQQWKNEYDESLVKHIVDQYQRFEKELPQLGEYYSWRRNYVEKEVRSEAITCLKEILNKKLFNAQCLWRAGKLELPLINTTDIHAYEHQIFRCRFLEPITREEMEVFVNYYMSDEYEPFDTGLAQEHERLCSAYHNIPFDEYNPFFKMFHGEVRYLTWYQVYDQHFGTADLLHLDDIKKEEEQKYIQAYRDKNKVEGVDFRNSLRKNYLATNSDNFHKFAEALGDVRMLPYFRDYDKCHNSLELLNTEIQLDYLQNVFFREVPLPAKDDWREAIEEAYVEDLKKETLKILADVYDEYLQNDYFYELDFNQEKWDKDRDFAQQMNKPLMEGKEYLEGKQS